MKICKQEIAALVRGMGGSDPLLGIWMPSTEFAAATVPNQDDGAALLAQATPSVGNSGASTFSVSPGYTTPATQSIDQFGQRWLSSTTVSVVPAPEPAPSFNQACLERGGYNECSNSWGNSSGGSGGGGSGGGGDGGGE